MRTSIFYTNSAGITSQWKGQVIAKDETSISIRFSKNKALKFKLKDLDIDFCLITTKPVKDLGINKMSEVVSFDDRMKEFILNSTKGNIASLWTNKKWAQ